MGTSLALRTTHPDAPRFALWLSSAGLEATCIYAWAAFALTLISDQRYSALLAVSAFSGASLLSRALAPARLRLRELAALHAAGLTLFSLLSVHSLVYSNIALWRASWLLDLVFGSKSVRTYGTIALAVFFSWILWSAGFRHGRERSGYERVCSRFDRGILWLGALFALKLLWRGQRGANLDDGVTGSLIAPYFLFATVALASARNRGMGAKSVIGGYRGLGRIGQLRMSGVLVALACVLLFLPELRTVVSVSYESLRELGGPLGSAFVFLLYLVFGLWLLINNRPHEAAQTLRKQSELVNPRPEHHDHAILPLQDIPVWVTWLIVGALLAGILLTFCYLLWRAIRTAAPSGSSVLARLWRWANSLWSALRQAFARAPEQPEAVKIYVALLQWGRRSGSPHRPSETPLEYASRLQRRLPALGTDIELIATSYSAHVYGPRLKPEWSEEKAALRRLRSLKLWPQRFRLWLTGDADESHSLGIVS